MNPRYFAVAGNDRDVVNLTGSHVNNNLHDGLGPGRECPGTPELFDFDAYVRFLVDHGHNFIRLWRWEQFKGYLQGADVHFCMTPQPWARTGPGRASDGKARFDLSTFDPAYFDRLRERVVAAGEAGFYVSVMLFEGFSLPPPDPSAGDPSYDSLEPARHALGDTRRFAADVDLAAVEPRGDLTSTGYALAWPGHQYVVLRPAGSDPSITVTWEPGTYTARWFDVDHRREQDAARCTPTGPRR